MHKEIEYTPEELATEEWRDVKGSEGWYQVSNLGRVKSLDRTFVRSDGKKAHKKGQILKPIDRNGLGYMAVNISKGGKKTLSYVHRLVALTFLENDDPKYKTLVNHKDENSMNNRVSNLEWATFEENARWGTLLQRRSKPVTAIDKETNEVVDTFKSIKEAAELFDMCSSHISACCRNERNTANGYKWKFN